eukprot:9469460-Pyramimonas_sp.AAC.1
MMRCAPLFFFTKNSPRLPCRPMARSQDNIPREDMSAKNSAYRHGEFFRMGSMARASDSGRSIWCCQASSCFKTGPVASDSSGTGSTCSAGQETRSRWKEATAPPSEEYRAEPSRSADRAPLEKECCSAESPGGPPTAQQVAMILSTAAFCPAFENSLPQETQP